jgi:hypothetical protein
METIVLKKVGIVTAVAAAGALTFGGIALADGFDNDNDGHSHDHVYAHKVQECDHHETEGVLQFPRDSDSSNNDSHDGDCDQENSPSDD